MSDLSLDQWLPELQSDASFLNEEMLTELISQRVGLLLADHPDLLFSFLYRLDVDENKIQHALGTGDEVSRALATLIIERQKQRIMTKNRYRSGTESTQSTFDPLDF